MYNLRASLFMEVWEAGVRVVRGPDWFLDDSEGDGGEGFLGTVCEVGGKLSDLPEKMVRVQWDSGVRKDHRVGYGGAYDLCVFDNAPIGVLHPNISCDTCQQTPIIGMRWRCMQCDGDCNLCTPCYMKDEHDTTHAFERIDHPRVEGIDVGVRHNEPKVQARGIFTGCKVMRGADWEYGEKDGGEGKQGTVTKITEWMGTPLSAVEVLWNISNEREIYRLNYRGKVDLMWTEGGDGGFYYKSHLPALCDKRLMKEKCPDFIPKYGSCTTDDKGGLGQNGKVESHSLEGGFASGQPKEDDDSSTQMEKASVEDITENDQLLSENQDDSNQENSTDHDSFNTVESDEVSPKILHNTPPNSSNAADISLEGMKEGSSSSVPFMSNWESPPATLSTNEWKDTDSLSTNEDEGGVSSEQASECKDTAYSDGSGINEPLISSPTNHVVVTEPGKAEGRVSSKQGKPSTVDSKMVTQEARLITDQEEPKCFLMSGASRSVLHKAAINGEYKTVELLLENGEDVDRRDKFHLTPLHLAAWYGQEPVVKVLLEHNADVNALDKFQKTPLQKARRNNHMAIVELLEAKLPRPHLQIASLRLLCKMELVRTDWCSGLNLFQAAVIEGNYDIALKVSVFFGDPTYAVKVEPTKNNAKVWPGKTAHEILSDLETPAHIKLKTFFEETFEKVATLSDLHRCAVNGDMEHAVEIVLEEGGDVNVKAFGNRTPLLWGSLVSCSEMIECLIELGADTNAQRDDNVTAATLATEWNNYMTVQLLAQNGTDVDIQDGSGNTLLHNSVAKGSFHLAQLLVDSGCNVNIKNKQDQSALHLAVEKNDKETTELLLTNTANPNIHQMQTFQNRLFLVRIEDKQSQAWHYILVNKPILGLFSKKIHEESVVFKDFGIVLESGSGEYPPKGKTEQIERRIGAFLEETQDMTPLHLACLNKNLEIVDLLLQHGADVNAVDADGFTTLHVAAICGNLNIVKKLVEHKADISLVTTDGRYATHLAYLNKETDIGEYLSFKNII